MQEQTKEEEDAFDIINERRDLKLEASIADLMVSQFQADRLRNKLNEGATGYIHNASGSSQSIVMIVTLKNYKIIL